MKFVTISKQNVTYELWTFKICRYISISMQMIKLRWNHIGILYTRDFSLKKRVEIMKTCMQINTCIYVDFEIVLNTTKWWLVTNLKSCSEANSEWQECAQKSMYIHISMNE